MQVHEAMHMADSYSEMTAVDQDDGPPQPPRPRSTSSSDEESVTGRESRVGQLARTFSRNSTTYPSSSSAAASSSAHNPFLHPKEPSLDPSSPAFDAKKWVTLLLGAFSQDPDRYARHTLGVSYRDLGVHGFGRPTDYQKDVLNTLWRAPMLLREKVAPQQQQTKIQILKDFDGLIQRGEMLLVLGRPGSGVSTLLKTISGQTHGLHMDPSSRFNYQGIPWDMMHQHFRGEVIYQAETDVHFPQLTVGDTLLFSALARTPQNRLPGVSRRAYAEHLRDVVMSMYGIYHTMNTRVGDDFVRGVSGGERKRVSIAEVTLSQSGLQCWDNSTRGLDSATALGFTKILRLATELGETAAVVAMYQASQPAYDVFDKVAVLYEGRQIYFGHKDEAKAYFTDMGWHCPERQTTADFLTSLTNPDERTPQPGCEDKVPKTPDDFARAWHNSAARAKLMAEIDAFDQEYPLRGDEIQHIQKARKAQQSSLMRLKSPYTISVPMQIQLCMSRGYLRLMGDKTFFLVTVLGMFMISLVLGSVFYDLPDTADSMNRRCILLYFAILFNALMSALEILTLYVQRPIVEKHNRYALYHPFSEAISSMICDLPSKLLSTLAFNIPMYFMAQLRQDAGAFFIFLLFGFTTTLTMSMIFRTIGQTSKTIHQALTPAAIFIIALVIYTGFVLPTRNMQGWLRWINYLDPIAYAYEAFVANEFSGRDFPCASFIPQGPSYVNSSATERTCSTAGALPGQSFVNGDIFINNSYGYYKSHIWRNFGILIAYIIFFMGTYIVAAEYISLSHSKGEVLVFQRGHKASRAALGSALKSPAQDEEAGAVAPGDEKVQREAGHGTSSSDDLEKARDADGRPPTAQIQKQRAIFHWKDVCYDIKIKGTPRRILDHVDGWVKPGTLTALMGATGAGKTTLLDVLANRVSVGVVTGDMSVNGQPRGHSFQRKTGYVQQQDVHLATATVREALRFSAALRQPASVSLQAKYDYVEEVIALLEMERYAEAVVGVPGEGLNVEQRKRLTIGVELAAKPDLLLFLDEPTSGLDSQTAWSISMLVRKLANNGQAILCTIHQPSALLFQQFDRLLLLAKGGRTVYFGDIGPNADTMTQYFVQHDSNGAVDPCGRDENPAEWMLRVIGAAPGAHTDTDWPAVWRTSEQYAAVQRELHALESLTVTTDSASRVNEADDEAEASKTYAAPFRTQFWMVLRRVFEQYWRTPSYIYSKLILCCGTSLFIGVSFYKAPVSEQGLQDQMFSIFMLLVIFAFLVYQTMPHYLSQRSVYEVRERQSRTYSWYTFMLANILVEIPWATLAAVLVFFPFYYLVGMYRNAIPTDAVTERGATFFLLVWAFLLFEATFADMVIAGIETAELGATVALLLFAMTLIFCGVMATPAQLPGFWIFMYRVSPLTYLISALLSTGIANQTVQCSALELLTFNPPAGQTCAAYLADYFVLTGGVGTLANPDATTACELCSLSSTNSFLASVSSYYDQRWRNFGFMWVYIGFNVLAALGLYWLARVPRSGGRPPFLIGLVGKIASFKGGKSA